jgi:cellulose synthase/poly-beta-1,6-N-acetylglucosamine synthase-like glycosyltransferase
VLIPARDEADDIEACLTAVAHQDYPLDRLEVIVVDGGSSDDTAMIARRTLGRVGFGSCDVLTNTDATTPSNLNLGLSRATGSILCRVDARTRIEPHYVRTCVQVLEERPDVAVIGGAQVATPRDSSALAVGIARALNNRYSMGGSAYRRATVSSESDTVYLGAFRTAQLRQVQGWDPRFATNQDFDLNRRMAALGVVWFDARLRSGYIPRATLGALWRQYERFGRAKVRYWRTSRSRPQTRQWILLASPVILLLVGLGAFSTSPRLSAGLGVTAMVVGEAQGTSGPQGSAAARGVALVAMAVVATAWTTGVWREVANVDHP